MVDGVKVEVETIVCALCVKQPDGTIAIEEKEVLVWKGRVS